MKRRDNVNLKQSAISNLSSMRSERRHLQSVQIRKSKRTQILAVKRRLHTSNGSNDANKNNMSLSVMSSTLNDTSNSSEESTLRIELVDSSKVAQQLRQLCTQYIQASANRLLRQNLLSAIQSLISRADTDISCIYSLMEEDENTMNDISSSLAMHLVETLSRTLLKHPTIVSVNYEEQMDASRVLTNLAATESPSERYYGRPTPLNVGWCGILMRSEAFVALLHPIHNFTQYLLQQHHQHHSANITQWISTDEFEYMLHLCEQCCWAVGNLAGDSQEARNALIQKGAIAPLIQCLQSSFQIHTTLLQNNNASLTNGNVMFGLCRNAAWALSNMARGAETSALAFLQSTTAAATASDTTRRLTADDLADILLSPHIMTISSQTDPFLDVNSIQNESSSSAPLVGSGSTQNQWMEVAYETCWILAFLTAREHEAVQILCSPSDNKTSKICQALSHCLAQVVHIVTHTTIESNRSCALRIFIPCIRAIGNIATACNGMFVPHLLTSTATSNSETNKSNSTIPSSIATLTKFNLSIHNNHPLHAVSFQQDLEALIPEAVWAAGTLLCDLPHYNTSTLHPNNHLINGQELSQNIIPILIPTLCHLLTSHKIKLDVKKEAASALWNALAPSPNANVDMGMGGYGNSHVMGHPNIIHIMVETPHMIRSLVELLSKPDADMTFLSLRLIDALLRQIPNDNHGRNQIKIQLEEAGIVDVLDGICDHASSDYYFSNGQSNDENNHVPFKRSAADLAADLIDDYFSEECFEENLHSDQSQSLGHIFSNNESTKSMTLGFPDNNNTRNTTFAFGTGINNNIDDNGGLDGTLLSGIGRGRGRGRGTQMPAWMKQT